jgi:hypothetical protein
MGRRGYFASDLVLLDADVDGEIAHEAVNDVGPNLVVPAPDDSPNRGQASFFLSVRVDTPMSTLVDIRHDGRKPRRRLRVCRALHHEGPSSVTTLVDIPRERYPWRSALLKARGV